MIYAAVCTFLPMRESLHAYMCVQLLWLTSAASSIYVRPGSPALRPPLIPITPDSAHHRPPQLPPPFPLSARGDVIAWWWSTNQKRAPAPSLFLLLRIVELKLVSFYDLFISLLPPPACVQGHRGIQGRSSCGSGPEPQVFILDPAAAARAPHGLLKQNQLFWFLHKTIIKSHRT